MILATILAFALWQSPATVGPNTTVAPKVTIGVSNNPIVADTPTCTQDGSAPSVTSISCGNLTSVTPGDLIVCTVTEGDVNVGFNVSDPSNGIYNNSMSVLDANSTQYAIISYKENATGGTYAPVLTMGEATGFIGLSCKTYKNARIALAQDSGAIVQQQQTTGINPNAGTAKSPSGNGELIWGVVEGPASPTLGSGFSASGTLANENVHAEAQIQTTATATNCPWTNASVAYLAECVGFLSAGTSAGVTPFTGGFLNFEGGTNGVAPTTTTLNNSYFTSAGGQIGAVSNTHSSLTYCTAAQLHNLLTNIVVNGSTKDGSGSLGLCYATGTGGDQFSIAAAAGLSNVTYSRWFKTTVPNNDTLGNAYSLGAIRSADATSVACNPQILPSGTALPMLLETNAGDASGSIAITSGTLYEIQVNYATNGTNTICQLAMFDSTGTQVGSTLSKTIAVANKVSGVIQVGISGAESETAGFFIYEDDYRWTSSGAFPMGH